MPKQTFFNLPEEKRERIIDIAMDEFASRSYTKASLSNIVIKAGIAKGSMYQYFANKKDLYTYLLNLAAQEKLAYVQKEGIDSGDDFFTMFEKVMFAGTRFNLEHPRLGQIMANAMDPSGEEVLSEIMPKLRQQSMDFIKNMLIKAKEQGNVRQDVDTRLTAHLLSSMLGVGLLEYLLDIFNVTIYDLLTKPEVAEKLTEDEIKKMIGEVMKLLRKGLEEWG